MERIQRAHEIGADPAGVALLLADPAGRELWPRGRARFGAPQRSGVGFACDVTVLGIPPARGRLAITTGREPGLTEVWLMLQVDGAAAAVAADGARFLGALAVAAQARSSAA